MLVMDNVRFHHVNEVKQLIEGRGYKAMYLPAYSPELNPIENFWAVLKSKVRPQITEHNSFDGICDLVYGAALEMKQQSIENMIRHSIHQFEKCELLEDI